MMPCPVKQPSADESNWELNFFSTLLQQGHFKWCYRQKEDKCEVKILTFRLIMYRMTRPHWWKMATGIRPWETGNRQQWTFIPPPWIHPFFTILWKIEPLKWRLYSELGDSPFSPVQRARKFSHVFGTTSEYSWKCPWNKTLQVETRYSNLEYW